MMDPKPSSSVVPNQYYAAIGRVAAGWAFFEAIVNHAIWELANVEQHVGACITAQIISPIARFRALVALLKLRGADQSTIATINSLSSKANRVSRQRNRLVHDPSTVNARTGVFDQLRITADRTLEFKFARVRWSERFES